MKLIKLTKGFYTRVDDDNFDELNKFKWHIDGRGYAHRWVWDKKTKKSIGIKMHKFIYGNNCSGIEVDHINGDKLDNMRSNLRGVTHSQNSYNQRPRRDFSYKGVSRVNDRSFKKPFTASIMFNYQRIHIGYFSTEEEAAAAYDCAAMELFGEYARLNW